MKLWVNLCGPDCPLAYHVEEQYRGRQGQTSYGRVPRCRGCGEAIVPAAGINLVNLCCELARRMRIWCSECLLTTQQRT